MTIEDQVKHWVRPEIRQLAAYHVQDAAGLVKLDAMENPYTWPDELRAEWSRLVAATDVNRYPDPAATDLKRQLAASMGVPDGMDLLLGNGSDEIIQMIIMALAGPGRSVLSVEPGFVMYRMIATFCGVPYHAVPLRGEDFALDTAALLQAIEQYEPAVIFLAYPNNPTANLFDVETLGQVIERAPGLVVIDEAYAPFTDASFMGRLGDFDNLLVMRTVSKMGLAGLRLGLLAGPAAWLNEFDKVRLPYNINVLTQVSAAFALRHQSVFDAQTDAIRSERARLATALQAMPGLQVFPSEANFILVRVPPGRATDVFGGIRQRGVLIKNMHGAHESLRDCLRLTVGTPEENDRLLAAIADALRAA